jgi:hypothetical protein
MQSIDTTQIDNYAQTMLADRTIDVRTRALHVSLAMRMHVLTEFGLPVDAALPMDDDLEERAYWCEMNLEHAAEHDIAGIIGASMATFDWMENNHPEPEGEVIPGLVRLIEDVKAMETNPVMWPVLEGNAVYYNDDKDEQA